MINGVMSIVAAVLFAVVALNDSMKVIWLTIAGIYFVWGILNLVVYVIRNYRRQKAAQQALKKAEEKAAQQSQKMAEERIALTSGGSSEEKPAEHDVTVGG